ncbi:MAG: OmpA family protein [bacterium]
MKKIILILSFAISALLISCVSAGKYDEMVYSRDSLQILYDSAEKVIEQNNIRIDQQEKLIADLEKRLRDMEVDLFNTKDNYAKLKENSSTNTRDMMDNIEKLQRTIADKQREMLEFQDKYNQIQSKLKAREEAMDKLRNKLQKALLGFADKGMTVSIQNGKVYVSLSNQLLFSTGSTDIDQKGKEALLELAKVLNEQPDINILVEGHTDNQQIRPGGRFKDNWDLSVMRSTEVIRYLTQEGQVDPLRITSSGKGEYYPIEKGDTPEIRAVNRRTEIILSPKLEELLDIINE